MPDEQAIPVWLDWAGTISPIGLLALAIMWVLTGGLIPRRTVPFLISERDERLRALAEERDQWRSAAELAQKANAEKDEQLSTLLEHAEVTVVLLQSIKNQAG